MHWVLSVRSGQRMHRRLWLVAGVAMGAVMLVAGSVLAGDVSSPTASLSADDEAALCAVISEWNQGKAVAWPAELNSTRLSKAEAADMNEAYRELVSRVGTAEFVKAQGSRDIAGDEEYTRKEAPESVCLAHEAKVVSVELVDTTDEGDVVVRAMVWQGWRTGLVDIESGKVVKTFMIDQSPVHMYVARKTQNGWRLVAEYRYYQESADADRSQYGADTPHTVRAPTSEWHLD